jgi:hypothetical protein
MRDVAPGAVVPGEISQVRSPQPTRCGELCLTQTPLLSGQILTYSIMVNFPGRNGRRRRVLNEEVLSASSTQAARRAASEDVATQHAPRYSDAAGVENHPQITDFVPRRYRTIVLLLLSGFAATVTLGGLHYGAPALTISAGIPGIEPFDLAAAGSLADWVAAVVLLLASAMCLLVYSIRRHRIDDYRGRYRVWLAASAACLVLSANSVASLHSVLAYALNHFTGWTALRDGSAWWLMLAGPLLGWIAMRTFFDVKECRLAGVLMIVAFTCHVVAAASYLGFVPGLEPRIESMVTGIALLIGHWSLLTAATTYARFVVLDAQGLIDSRPVTVKRRPAKTNVDDPKPVAAATTVLSAAGYNRQKLPQIKPAQTPADAKTWIDGSRPERDSYDDSDDDTSGPSKLSKAERKRLRKLKAQNRAA